MCVHDLWLSDCMICRGRLEMGGRGFEPGDGWSFLKHAWGVSGVQHQHVIAYFCRRMCGLNGVGGLLLDFCSYGCFIVFEWFDDVLVEWISWFSVRLVVGVGRTVGRRGLDEQTRLWRRVSVRVVSGGIGLVRVKNHPSLRSATAIFSNRLRRRWKGEIKLDGCLHNLARVRGAQHLWEGSNPGAKFSVFGTSFVWFVCVLMFYRRWNVVCGVN